MIVFTACGGNNTNDNPNDAQNGVVQDGDGVIDENNDNNIVDNAANGAEDMVNGATNAVDDVANGTRKAIDNMTGTNGNNNSRKSMN